MELHIVIEGNKDLAGQVYRQLREAIRTGRLAPGEQVPPSRLLATQLGLSRKTVSEAYSRLTLEKLLVGRTGSGTFVNTPADARPKPKRFESRDLAAGNILAHWLKQSFPLSMRHVGPETRSQYDFLGGIPTRRQFPQAAWRQCVLHGLRQSGESRGVYAETEGLPALREAIARHVSFSRGVQCTAADVLVTNGAQQALDLIARVLVEPGSVVAVEDPGYPPARVLFAAQGAEVAAVPVDNEGIRVDLIPDGARLIYVTPAHQFPLGMPMSPARREALLVRARELRAIVVEDDYDSEFRYEGRPMDSLQSMDQDGLVAFVGTFSKVMHPDLRVGYVIAPPAIRRAMTIAKGLSDWHTPTMTQWALARFIDDGHLQKHIRRCHDIYVARREKLHAALNGDLKPWMRAVPTVAGFHLAATMTAEVDMAQLVRLARRVDVALYTLDEFYYRLKPQPALFFGYGAIESLDIEVALGRVKTILTELSA
ncbi:PLP-dependent aminotransferase family protein [Herbaspirillum sp. RV1423]|uniref:MocR-like pyridoxine biosynthesis transcription factor PdxR n=1 Tax=Herbaspirillum sp. RV1423 TaxID=1443993 RepID=UPI0004B7A972|nr:PLP-dependent aminotransferase family protein [Herbaspirillum sp. RV1423]